VNVASVQVPGDRGATALPEITEELIACVPKVQADAWTGVLARAEAMAVILRDLEPGGAGAGGL
jgi:hypothetical protein